MKVDIQPGRYVIAVSGGVDSISLLHLLQSIPDVKLTVAHFDHGIRGDSNQDKLLVQSLAKKYGLPFVYHRGELGAKASEAVARESRYAFLRQVQKTVDAEAIITAHHQDDVLETAIINMLRGTGRKGLTSLKSHRHLVRPMLAVSKSDVRAYAVKQGLVWREDSTNQDLTILRNYIRKIILPKLGKEGKSILINHINNLLEINNAIDDHLQFYLHLQPSRQVLNRYSFILLPHNVALEITAQWLRSHGITTFNTK
ncbi:tRNA lysidine(34) synthetase TilS, partial [Candidatus Saccharibacteria bacterium]|nr:tRNA lysidine(34) synthetase TilS [Candidatus Saccharibacteria bacterium]